MRAIVSGTAGFIGSHPAEELIRAGAVVDGINCLTSYYSPKLKMKNLSRLMSVKDFHLVRTDILRVDLDKLLRKADIVFHLAA